MLVYLLLEVKVQTGTVHFLEVLQITRYIILQPESSSGKTFHFLVTFRGRVLGICGVYELPHFLQIRERPVQVIPMTIPGYFPKPRALPKILFGLIHMNFRQHVQASPTVLFVLITFFSFYKIYTHQYLHHYIPHQYCDSSFSTLSLQGEINGQYHP